MGLQRNKFGRRRHRASIYESLGTIDDDGWPSIEAGEVSIVVADLPCSLISLTGSDANHSHDLFCDFSSAETVKPQMIAVIDDQTFEVLALDDIEGLRREYVLQLRLIDVPPNFHTDSGT